MTESSGSQNLLRMPLDLIDAGEAVELLEGDEAHAEGGGAAEHAPAVAVGVDGELGVAAEGGDAGEADAVEGDHDAGAAVGEDDVMGGSHFVDFAGDVEGEHDFFAGFFGVGVEDGHDCFDAGFEGAVGAVRLQFVVFDEIDAACGELGDHGGGGFGAEAHAGFDDGSDERERGDARELAGAGDAELGAGVAVSEGLGELDVEEFETGELLEFEEVSGDGGH